MNNQDEFRHRYLMNRRAFVGMAAAGAASPLLARAAAAQPAPKARNVVLVHGLFADGSCWSEVIARFQQGAQCTAVQNPLTTLPEAVAAAQRVLARQQGPTVLVGHSFSGMIVTEAGVDPKVSALVYVAARAPDAGEDYTALANRFPTPPATAGIVFDDDWGRLTEEASCATSRATCRRSEARRSSTRSRQPIQEGADYGKDDECRMAHQAELLCRFHRRPDHQSRSRTLHGQADGRKNDRGRGKPPCADLTARCDHEPDPGGGRTDLNEKPL